MSIVVKTPKVKLWSDLMTERESNSALRKQNTALLAALKGLFEHCAMMHNKWGDGCNQREADAAITNGRAAMAQAEEGAR